MAPSFGCTDNFGICITSIVILCLIYILLIPFMIISTLKFYRIKHIQGISARYPTIIIATSIYNILHIFIIDQYILISNGISPTILQQQNIVSITNMIFPLFLFIIPIVTALRIWLINFDIKHALAKSTQDWQMLLASSVDTNDWYSQNKSKCGNWKWLMKICILLWFFISICVVLPVLLSYSIHISQLLYITFLVILLITISIIWHRTPYFQDTFCIKQEMKLLLICDIICAVIWFALIFWAEYGNIFELIQRFTVICIHFIQVLISVHWVIGKQRTLHQYNKRSMKNETICMHNLCDFMNFRRIDKEFEHPFTRSRSRSVEQRLLTNQRLFNVLIATDIGINCLFEHLKREFCFESLLFLIEIVQWIYSVTDKKFDVFDITPLLNIQFEFAKIVPISSINNMDCDWFSKMNCIYNKYIASSGEYQVNLPWNIQNEYYNLLRLYTIKREINDGVYKPKLKRKTHHKTSRTFWNRIKKEHGKENQIKYQKSNDCDVDDDVIKRKISIPKNRSFNKEQRAIPENETLTPNSPHIKQNDTVDLGIIGFRNHNELILEQKPNFSEGDIVKGTNIQTIIKNKLKGVSRSPKLSPMVTPFMTSRSNTLVERSSELIDTDSDEEHKDDYNLIQNIDTTPMMLKSGWKDPSIEDSDDLSGDKHTKHDWNTSEIVVLDDDNEIDDNGGRFHNEDDDVETPIPMDTTRIMNRESTESKLNNIYSDVIGSAGTIEYDKSASKTVTFHSNISKVINIGNSTYHSKTMNAPISQTTNQLNDIFEEVLNKGSVSSVNHKEIEEEKVQFDKNHLMLPTIMGSGSAQSTSTSMAGNVLNKISLLIAHSFTPSMANNISPIDNDDEIDEDEQKQMEKAKSITLNHFVSVSSRAMYEILKLNYHSVARFKKSIQYKTFEESVNLNDLLNMFGDKGCS